LYQGLIERRLQLIDSDPSIRILETPEFKRRWESAEWAEQCRDALIEMILDIVDQERLWFDELGPRVRSIAEISDYLRDHKVVNQLCGALNGVGSDFELTRILTSIAPPQAVPYLAGHRYSSSGNEIFKSWQEVWAAQRIEDTGGVADIVIPPKYGEKDYLKTEYWKLRGKLDVPKERFILYPDSRREGDSTPVLGWAGWDHRNQALALGRELQTQEGLGADDEALVPLVAGLVELEPWLHQWHAEIDPEFNASPAAVISTVIDQYLLRMEKTREQVSAWTPPAPTRGRRPKKS
jgi:hypothetical protein